MADPVTMSPMQLANDAGASTAEFTLSAANVQSGKSK
jgi:hypothetical protein